MPAATTALVTVNLPGAVAAWLRDYDIDVIEPAQSPGEQEWRRALAGSSPVRRGSGSVYPLTVTPGAARELAAELRERADTEARLPVADRLADPRTLRRACDAIDKTLAGAEPQTQTCPDCGRDIVPGVCGTHHGSPRCPVCGYCDECAGA